MIESEYIVTTEQYYPVSVTTVETSVPDDYDFAHIQQNTYGIFLMTTGIFFLLVIYLISKLLGNFFSM